MDPSSVLLFERVDYVDYLEQVQHFRGRKKRRILIVLLLANVDGEANWSCVVNFHSMQMSLVSFLI